MQEFWSTLGTATTKKKVETWTSAGKRRQAEQARVDETTNKLKRYGRLGESRGERGLSPGETKVTASKKTGELTRHEQETFHTLRGDGRHIGKEKTGETLRGNPAAPHGRNKGKAICGRGGTRFNTPPSYSPNQNNCRTIIIKTVGSFTQGKQPRRPYSPKEGREKTKRAHLNRKARFGGAQRGKRPRTRITGGSVVSVDLSGIRGKRGGLKKAQDQVGGGPQREKKGTGAFQQEKGGSTVERKNLRFVKVYGEKRDEEGQVNSGKAHRPGNPDLEHIKGEVEKRKKEMKSVHVSPFRGISRKKKT